MKYSTSTFLDALKATLTTSSSAVQSPAANSPGGTALAWRKLLLGPVSVTVAPAGGSTAKRARRAAAQARARLARLRNGGAKLSPRALDRIPPALHQAMRLRAPGAGCAAAHMEPSSAGRSARPAPEPGVKRTRSYFHTGSPSRFVQSNPCFA